MVGMIRWLLLPTLLAAVPAMAQAPSSKVEGPLILAFGLGLITLVAAPFVAGLLHLIGTIKAYNGESWNPPLTPRFIS